MQQKNLSLDFILNNAVSQFDQWIENVALPNEYWRSQEKFREKGKKYLLPYLKQIKQHIQVNCPSQFSDAQERLERKIVNVLSKYLDLIEINNSTEAYNSAIYFTSCIDDDVYVPLPNLYQDYLQQNGLDRNEMFLNQSVSDGLKWLVACVEFPETFSFYLDNFRNFSHVLGSIHFSGLLFNLRIKEKAIGIIQNESENISQSIKILKEKLELWGVFTGKQQKNWVQDATELAQSDVCKGDRYFDILVENFRQGKVDLGYNYYRKVRHLIRLMVRNDDKVINILQDSLLLSFLIATCFGRGLKLAKEGDFWQLLNKRDRSDRLNISRFSREKTTNETLQELNNGSSWNFAELILGAAHAEYQSRDCSFLNKLMHINSLKVIAKREHLSPEQLLFISVLILQGFSKEEARQELESLNCDRQLVTDVANIVKYFLYEHVHERLKIILSSYFCTTEQIEFKLTKENTIWDQMKEFVLNPPPQLSIY